MPSSRREFLRQSTLRGIALVVTIPQLGCRVASPDEPLAAGPWIRIDDEGVVTLALDKMEMGQGVTTALPMIMAEELGANWDEVRVIQAEPGPEFTEMGTSGSGSVIDAWHNHRRAAAAARTMLVNAAAASWSVPADECLAESGEVRHRGSGRRARFGSLVVAARVLTVPTEPAFKPPTEYRLLGTRVPDPGLAQITVGRMPFGIDKVVPGMLYAVVERCPVHGGTVGHFSPERALAIDGVRQVVQVPSGVAIVATNTWAALKGRDALDVRWNEGPNADFDNAKGWHLLEAALRQPGKVARLSGDARRAMSGAYRRIQAEYRWPWQAHAALEPLNAVARVTEDRCDIWAGMQNPNAAQSDVAEALGLAPERVAIHPMRVGGAFGRRIATDFMVEAAHVSRAVRAPVQVVWTRQDDFRHDMYNPAQINRLAAGLDTRGRVIAWEHRVADLHLSMFGDFNPEYDPARDGDPWGGFDSPYAVSNMRVDLALAPSPIPTGAWRSVTYPAAVLARESFVDEIANAAGVDPLALRLSLIPSPGNETRGTLTIANGDRLRRVLQLAAERAGWTQPMSFAEPGRRAGRGIACNPYHRGTMVAQVAEVSVGASGDISVHRIISVVDGGQIINRAGVEKQFEGGVGWALSALLGPGVRFEGGRTTTASFAEYPVLRIDQMPEVETHIVDSVLRPFGMGEPPIPAVAPAVLNAVFAATGMRIRTLPIVPEDLRGS
jgi:isoquinoline 1-oxidoreductase beta subunit